MAFMKHHQVRRCTSTGQEMPKTHARCMYRKAVGVLGRSDFSLFGINPKMKDIQGNSTLLLATYFAKN